MSRLILAIALIFALASVSGPVVARVLAAGHFSTVAANADRCAEPAETVVEATAKPCPKKLNGHAIPCQQVPGVLPETTGYPLPSSRPSHLLELHALDPRGFSAEWFRPPRA